jgi:hypothetical protein
MFVLLSSLKTFFVLLLAELFLPDLEEVTWKIVLRGLCSLLEPP